MRSRILTLLLMLGLLAACSASPELANQADESASAASAADATLPEAALPEAATAAPEDTTTDAQPTPTSEAADTAADPIIGDAARDRIVIATAQGRVVLVDPDGGNELELASGGGAQGSQPVWSPDGRRIAWSERRPSGFSIVSSNVDGQEQRRASTLFSGYYGYWNPTSTRLGFLGNAPPGTGLVLDSGDGTQLDAVVDSDTFYYFSWSPDGTRWVVHSGSGLSIVDLDGTRTNINLPDARFRAPTWTASGDLILGIQTVDGGVIARVDPETQQFEELLEAGDAANFVLDPTGRYLAVETLSSGDISEEEEGITVSFRDASQVNPAQAEPAQGPPNQASVLVYDMETGTSQEVLGERSGGFWWSPDGTTLAVLVTDESEPTRFAQWLVWRAGESFRTGRFTVSPLYATTYVPFFDQFAQSVTPWAPDSSRFVFAGFDADGLPGVFVQPAEADAELQRIADEGAVAFWSPT